MAQTMQDLQDAISAQEQKIGELETTLTDFSVDIKAAIAKLQADIAAGQDTSASVSALVALGDRTDAMIAALKTLDGEAEGISGNPTP